MRATEARQQSDGNEEEARRRTKEANRNYFAFSIAQVEAVKPQKVERVVERRTKAYAALAALSRGLFALSTRLPTTPLRASRAVRAYCRITHGHRADRVGN